MSISTKDIVAGSGGGMLKTIQPGTHLLKINNIELKRLPFMEAENGYYLILNVETKPIAGFEGFMIDKDDESKGRYDGQIGQIKTNKYFYKDGKTKGGTVIERDKEILKQLKNICLASEDLKWFDSSAHNKYETIEEFIEGINKSKVFKDKFYNFCVAGKEFERKTGYTGYDLFFPKLTKGRYALELENAEPSKLLEFNEKEHWTKLEPKEVKEFGNDSSSSNDGDLLDGAPEFQL
jgi:hypothetical protein